MRKQVVTLKNKAKMLATELRQRIGVQRGNILTGDAIGAACGFIQQPRIFIRVDLPEPEAPTIATISPA